MEKGRLEAFSDGVFAVAITLLALALVVPSRAALVHGSLARTLGEQWPEYAAYTVSFVVVGIIWINHHGVLGLAARVDRVVLVVNLAVLLPVVSIPFATDLLAHYVRDGGFNGNVAAAVYSSVMLAMAVAMSGLYSVVLRREAHVHESVDVAAARANRRRYGSGQLLYAATVGVAFLSPVVTLVCHGALAVFYLADQVRPRA